jgi:hypothetical protein
LLTSAGDLAGTVGSPDLGLLVGVDGDAVVTYAACRGLPCPIVATDLVTGDHHALTDDAGLATLVATPEGTRLVHETRGGSGGGLRSVSLDGRATADALPASGDNRLAGTPMLGGTVTRMPPGWILLTPDGRLPNDPNDQRPQLRHIPDGVAVQLDEAVR